VQSPAAIIIRGADHVELRRRDDGEKTTAKRRRSKMAKLTSWVSEKHFCRLI